MIIRRDTRSFFHRKRGHGLRNFLLGILASLGVFALLMTQNLTSFQNAASRLVGIESPPTPYASEWATQGNEAFRRGDVQGAARNFERAISQQPTNVAYLYEYGKALIELGRYSDAAIVGDRAIITAPQDVRGYALKANATAYSDPTGAIITALQGEEIDPNFAPLYAAQSIANTQIFRYSQALTAGQKAIDLDPMDANSYRAYTTPLIQVGRYDEVIEALETAVSLNPFLTGAYFELAFEYKSRAEQPAMAIAIYQKILDDLNPSIEDAAKANLRICETYAGADNARFDYAEPYCRQAISIFPGYGSAYRELGRMQYNRRNYEGSIESFDQCVALGAQDIECWALRGLAYYWLAQCDDAWRVLNEALVISNAQPGQPLLGSINIGISNVQAKCPDYRNVAAPTVAPPTNIPPTPIGGL
jgi:tetratricopeptide (TPR) repeat protein